MYSIQKTRVVWNEGLLYGLSRLAELAESIYGTEEAILFQTEKGFEKSGSFYSLCQNAVFEEPEMAYAAAALKSLDLPKDGVKTIILLLKEFMLQSEELGMTKDVILHHADDITEMLCNHLDKAAGQLNGNLPGGGLTYITLQRPLVKYCRAHDLKPLDSAYIKSFAKPLLAIAKNAGAESYEAFERVKALSPNQFFSLHQVGIERSVKDSSPYADVITKGINLKTGKIENLCDAKIFDDLSDVKTVISFLNRCIKDFILIKRLV